MQSSAWHRLLIRNVYKIIQQQNLIQASCSASDWKCFRRTSIEIIGKHIEVIERTKEFALYILYVCRVGAGLTHGRAPFPYHSNFIVKWNQRPCVSDQRFTTSSQRTLNLFEMGSACMHTLAESPRGLGRGCPRLFDWCVFSLLKDAKFSLEAIEGGHPWSHVLRNALGRHTSRLIFAIST